MIAMKTVRLLSVSLFVFLLLTACAGSARPEVPAGNAGEGGAPARSLLLDVVEPTRYVTPGSEQVFDFKLVNTGEEPLRVVIALAHASGARWRTSLCVDKQCLLGDGSEPSVSDPIILPPYLEQPFQAHLFVDAAAEAGDATELVLRIEPQAQGEAAASVGLQAEVEP